MTMSSRLRDLEHRLVAKHRPDQFLSPTSGEPSDHD